MFLFVPIDIQNDTNGSLTYGLCKPIWLIQTPLTLNATRVLVNPFG